MGDPAIGQLWFKLLGNSDDGGAMYLDWASSEPGMLELMLFPTHRKPTNISNRQPIICYAVQHRKIFALQSRKPGLDTIRLRQPYGPKGSVTDRYPNEMDVVTHAYIPHLNDAPDLNDVLPAFIQTHLPKMRQGSHFQITPEDYGVLKTAVLASSRVVKLSDPAV